MTHSGDAEWRTGPGERERGGLSEPGLGRTSHPVSTGSRKHRMSRAHSFKEGTDNSVP